MLLQAHCNALLNPLSTTNFSTETENQSHTNTTRAQVNVQWLFIIVETSITGFCSLNLFNLQKRLNLFNLQKLCNTQAQSNEVTSHV